MPEITTDCPYCKEEINARATVCKHCGKEVDPIPEEKIRQALKEHEHSVVRKQHTDVAARDRKPASKSIAFGLWCIAFIGFAGIHRFYLGKNWTGLLYFLTWGFAGIGLLIDVFRLPQMVEDYNNRLFVENELANRNSGSRTISELPPAVEKDTVDEIRRLGALRDEGLLSEEEFAEKKRDLLRRL